MNNNLVKSWKEVVSEFSEADARWPSSISYLTSEEVNSSLSIDRLWSILDQAWDEQVNSFDAKDLLYKEDFLHLYYQHPVWLINAAFCESDPSTIEDRLAAIRLATHVNPSKILDFGGGIGTVSRLCAEQLPNLKVVDLVDVSEFSQTVAAYLSKYPQVRVLEAPEASYDAIICTEVLEHVLDPIDTVVELNKLLRVGGAFSASWSFAPCIKCHLPSSFHLKRLMPWIIRSLGFGFYGFERRGSMVFGFVKKTDVTPAMLKTARLLEGFSRIPLPIDRLLQLRGL